MKNIFFTFFLFSVLLIAVPVRHVYAQNTGKLVGAYQGAPGTLPVTLGNGTKSWVTGFPEHPTLGKYDTAGDLYINWSLDKMAELGVDFIVLDESNGIHLTNGIGQKALEVSLLKYMDIVDDRISRGIPTPKVTLMTPIIGIGNSCVEQQGGCLIGEADWIWAALVSKNGKPRPGWFWLNGKPFLGIYSVRPFTPTFTDNRYTIRQVCNAQSNECHQPQKDLGTVWFWATRNESGPLYSSRSDEVTIQNGFDNKIACQIFGNPPNCVVHEGYTPQYYADQWDRATGYNPQIIVITSFGGGEGLEGGQIEERVDFSPPTVYEDMTKEKILKWKGLPGDLNGDGKIDIYDYNLLVSNFDKNGSNIVGDIDKNNKVDIYDYNILVANFGK